MPTGADVNPDWCHLEQKVKAVALSHHHCRRIDLYLCHAGPMICMYEVSLSNSLYFPLPTPIL